jgi:hypothetical protein
MKHLRTAQLRARMRRVIELLGMTRGATSAGVLPGGRPQFHELGLAVVDVLHEFQDGRGEFLGGFLC